MRNLFFSLVLTAFSTLWHDALPATDGNYIVIVASKYVLELYNAQDELIRSYPVGLGRKGIGKTLSGDQKTPKGEYKILWKASRFSETDGGYPIIDGQAFCTFTNAFTMNPEEGDPDETLWTDAYGGDQAVVMCLNYPNEKDIANGYSGSAIEIHATKLGGIGENSSAGCIRMNPEDARELYNFVDEGTKVTICSTTPTPAPAQARMLRHDAFKVPLGLPPIPWPKDNPYSSKKAELGRLLYFDKRLSADGTIACATCHSVPRAFSDNHRIAVGINGHIGTRHSPTLINAAYQTHYFWDGRAATLEEQAKGPIANPNEMASSKDPHLAHQMCEEHVKAIAGYRPLFKEAFGSDEITIDTIAKAIATFERTIVSGNSPYDKYMAGNKLAMNKEQIAGLEVFNRTNCAMCHIDFNFTSGKFINIGIGMNVFHPDLGRYLITKNTIQYGSFKMPTLREVTKSAPYMHDGSIATLEEVIDYYDKGGIKNSNLHPFMKPLNLSKEDKKALLSFMYALEGEGWQHFRAPDKFPE